MTIRLVRLAPALAALAVGTAPLQAQYSAAVGVDVNAVAETALERAPLFFGSAGLAPRGRAGISVSTAAARVSTVVDGDVYNQAGRWNFDAFRLTGAAYWGATSRLTLGAYVSSAESELASIEPSEPAPGVTPTGDDATFGEYPGVPARRGTRMLAGASELGAYARVGLWTPAGGSTRVALAAQAYDRVDSPLAYAGTLALQRRLGRTTVHLAPTLHYLPRIAGNPDGTFSRPAETTVTWAGGLAQALTRDLSVSVEALHYGERTTATEIGGGMRYRVYRLSIDAGIRALVADGGADGDPRMFTAMLGTHVAF